MRLVSSCMTVIRSNHCFPKKIQVLLAIIHSVCGSMHVVRPSVVVILVLLMCSSHSNDSWRIQIYPLDVTVCLDLKTTLCRILDALLVQKQRPGVINGQQRPGVINGQRFGKFSLHPPFHPCWTIRVERISSVKWTGVQPVALCPGFPVIALFEM